MAQGVLYTLKQNGISGKLFDIISDFLNFRKQRVVLNGQHSSWTSTEAGLPQGSILTLYLQLIYLLINIFNYIYNYIYKLTYLLINIFI